MCGSQRTRKNKVQMIVVDQTLQILTEEKKKHVHTIYKNIKKQNNMETLFLMSQVVKSYKRNIQSLEEKKKKTH